MTVTTLEDAEKVAAKPQDFNVRSINRAINILAHSEISSPTQKALIDAKIKIMSDTVKDSHNAWAGHKHINTQNPNPEKSIRTIIILDEPLTIKLKELAKRERRSVGGQAAFMLAKLLNEIQ